MNYTKYIITTIAILVLLNSINAVAQSTTVYTPHGTLVPYVSIQPPPELTPAQIALYNKDFTNWAGTQNLISNSSNKYNCHAYAWLGRNDVHMVGRWVFWEDYSYVEVSAANAPPGAIVHWEQGHSAILTSTPGVVISKLSIVGPVGRHTISDYNKYELSGFGTINPSDIKYYVPMYIAGPDVIGATCSATYTPGLSSSGTIGVSWQVVGGAGSGITPYSGSGTSFTVSRTSNLNDPANATIRFSITNGGNTCTYDKNIVARIEPVIYGVANVPYGVPYGFETTVNQPTYFISQINGILRPYIQEYQWEVITNVGVGYVLLSGEHTTTPVYFPYPGSYRVSLRVRDGCQWSKWDEKYVQVY